MVVALEVATLVFVAIAMAQALAHALELPGKLRVDPFSRSASTEDWQKLRDRWEFSHVVRAALGLAALILLAAAVAL